MLPFAMLSYYQVKYDNNKTQQFSVNVDLAKHDQTILWR